MKLQWYAYVFLALVLAIALQSIRLDLSQRHQVSLKASVISYKVAQESNLKTIENYKQANLEWSLSSQKQLENAKYYLDASREYGQIETAKAIKAQKSLDNLYAKHPEARAWSVIPVDAAVASSLRASSH